MVTQPVLQQVGDTIIGQGRAGQAIDFVLSIGGLGIDITTDDADFDIALFIKDFFTIPLGTPFRVVHFTPQARRFGMFIETQTGDGIEVAFSGRNE